MDWTGNKKSVFITLGASNHTEKERQKEDFYATDPKAMHLLCDQMQFSHNVWECACGQGHLAKVLIERGYNVRATDLIDRGFGDVQDFLGMEVQDFDGDIITNPPFKYATEFVYKALSIIPEGRKVAMFLKLQFLEGKARRVLYDNAPPKFVYVFSNRINCAMNGDFEKYTHNSAVAYGWFVWEKGYKGETIIKWI